jgi:hypothetical protein
VRINASMCIFLFRINVAYLAKSPCPTSSKSVVAFVPATSRRIVLPPGWSLKCVTSSTFPEIASHLSSILLCSATSANVYPGRLVSHSPSADCLAPIVSLGER